MSTSQSETMPIYCLDQGETNTLLELRQIFHTELLMMTLHHHNTREKMMNMLNTAGNPTWTAENILKLASDNKIVLCRLYIIWKIVYHVYYCYILG